MDLMIWHSDAIRGALCFGLLGILAMGALAWSFYLDYKEKKQKT